MFKRYRFRDYDYFLVLLLIAISVIGILAVGSAQESIQSKQIIGLVSGVFLMIFISLIDYTLVLKLYWIIYIFNLVLLILVDVFGSKAGGAQRWMVIFGIQFQPSELAKILLILFYSQFIMKYREKINTIGVIVSALLLFLLPLYLVYSQPDLSTSIMLCVLFCTMFFAGGISYKIIAGILTVIIPSLAVFLALVLNPNQNIIEKYQQTRILAWLNPSDYVNTEGYQQFNSVMAIGSGQLFGKGLNNNVIGSVKNGNFISEPQTDFIFAIIGEELGFVGSLAVILILMLITLRCLLIAKKSKDLAGTIIGCGMASIVGFQSFMNIAVATSLMPNTGIPLPFVSAGLTSLISLYIGMGFVLNVRLQGNNNTSKERSYL